MKLKKGKNTHVPKALNGRGLFQFREHEACLEVLLLPPGRDASPSQGYPLPSPPQYLAGIHLYT